MDRISVKVADQPPAAPVAADLSLLSLQPRQYAATSETPATAPIVDKRTILTNAFTNVPEPPLKAFQPVPKPFSDALSDYTNSTLAGAFGLGAGVGLWAGRGVSLDGKMQITVSDGLNGGVRSSVAGFSDMALNAFLTGMYPRNDKLFQPSIPETLAVGAAAALPDWRLRAGAVGGAWLLGRAYNYTWDRLSSK
jgi:hypothetical protein